LKPCMPTFRASRSSCLLLRKTRRDY